MRKTLLFAAVLYSVGALAADPTPQTPPADPAPAATAKRPRYHPFTNCFKG